MLNINILVAISVLIGVMGLSSFITYNIVNSMKVVCPPQSIIEQPVSNPERASATKRFRHSDFKYSGKGKGF